MAEDVVGDLVRVRVRVTVGLGLGLGLATNPNPNPTPTPNPNPSLHGGAEEDVATAAQRHHRRLQLVEHGGQLRRAHHVGAQRDALDHGHARVVEDEVEHGDEDAARHADLEVEGVDQQEGAPGGGDGGG